MNKSIFIIIILFSMIFLSCPVEKIEFSSTKTLTQWYDETAEMEGNTYWNSIYYPLPDPTGITVSRLIIEDTMPVDIYFPSGHEAGAENPVIITPRIFKKSDEFQRFGRSILTMEYEISWAHLLASEGYVVVKYESDTPAKALEIILTYINENHKALGIDEDRIGLWSISSNTKAVISFLAYGEEDLQNQIKCSAFFSPELKIGGPGGFSSLHHVPYFIAVGLKDDASTIKGVKTFVNNCIEAGLDYEYYEHPQGEHGFDAKQDDETTRKIIQASLVFFKKHLQ